MLCENEAFVCWVSFRGGLFVCCVDVYGGIGKHLSRKECEGVIRYIGGESLIRS